ncbi:MAG: VOC family protein, partial [Maribacter sp.]
LHMKQNIANVTLVVKDYDVAIQFYTQKLGFEVLQDVQLDTEKRWVLVAPPHAKGIALLLAKAFNDPQAKSIGNQTGGRVSFFLYTNDFCRDYNNMSTMGVVFKEKSRKEDYGTVAVFEDLYGNLWDLLEPKE